MNTLPTTVFFILHFIRVVQFICLLVGGSFHIFCQQESMFKYCFCKLFNELHAFACVSSFHELCLCIWLNLIHQKCRYLTILLATFFVYTVVCLIRSILGMTVVKHKYMIIIGNRWGFQNEHIPCVLAFSYFKGLAWQDQRSVWTNS